MSQQGSRVQFRVGDIYLPDPGEVLAELHGDDVLSGVELERGSSGVELPTYVVVAVDGLSRPVLVPVDRLLAPG